MRKRNCTTATREIQVVEVMLQNWDRFLNLMTLVQFEKPGCRVFLV